jgi:hypothetical protein
MEQLTQKQIFLINAKLQFFNKEEIIQFYVEADNYKQAETKLQKWLEEGNSNFKFADILNIWTERNIFIIV